MDSGGAFQLKLFCDSVYSVNVPMLNYCLMDCQAGFFWHLYTEENSPNLCHHSSGFGENLLGLGREQ